MRLKRERSLRHYLMAFGAALLAPVLVLAAVLVWQFARAEQRQSEERAGAAAERIVAAVDRELAGLQAAGQALASSAALRARDHERFQRRSLEIIRALPRPGSYAIVVRDLTGQQLVNTRLPWGTPLPKGAAADADREVVESKQPYVQDLFVGATASRPVLSVRIPVLVDETVALVLSVAFEPSHLAELLREQNLPPSWTATILDRNGRVIARSHDHERFVGVVPPESFGAARIGDHEVWRAVNLDGVPVLGAVVQSKMSGWRAFVGVPMSVVRAPLWRSLVLIAGLAAVLLGISFALAIWFGKRIAKPVQQLAENARALGQGLPVGAIASGVREVDEVAAAMASAYLELTAREAALRASEERRRATAENAAVGIVEVDRNGLFVQVNEAQCRLTGHSRAPLRPCDPQRFSRARPRAVRAAGEGRARRLYAREAACAHRWDRRLGAGVEHRRARPVRRFRIRGARRRGAERKRSEERQILLLNELNHRVKNTLATVQALAWQTLQAGRPPEVAREQFQGRLLALSRTHNLLNEAGWQSARLLDVARAELEPYEGQGRRRLTLEGDDVALPPRAAVALGMVLHELATNAAKYGSLSSGTGRLTLRWRIDRGEAPAGVLRLEWLESGGPTVARPAQQGFGSRLVKRLIEGELDGRLVVDFRPEGVRVEIAVPLGEARAEPDLERAA